MYRSRNIVTNRSSDFDRSVRSLILITTPPLSSHTEISGLSTAEDDPPLGRYPPRPRPIVSIPNDAGAKFSAKIAIPVVCAKYLTASHEFLLPVSRPSVTTRITRRPGSSESATATDPRPSQRCPLSSHPFPGLFRLCCFHGSSAAPTAVLSNKLLAGASSS